MHRPSRHLWRLGWTRALAIAAALGPTAAPSHAKTHAPPADTRTGQAPASTDTGRIVATITDPLLPEISGCAVTAKGIWMHNDSGNAAELFLVNPKTGRIKQRVAIAGATNIDWEDMAAESGNLYIGDIGDNSSKRDRISVYRVAEAALTKPAIELGLTYPDGPHNAEALFVHGGGLFIITKTDDPTIGQAGVYRLAQADKLVSGLYPLEKVATITITGESFLFPNRITGADYALSTHRLVLRTYENLYVMTVPAGQPFDSLWAQPPRKLEVLGLTQAEAVCVRLDGRHVLTTGERLPAPLIERALP